MRNAVAYAAQHRLKLAERLGFGIHGIIHVAENKSRGGKTAVKAHREREPYLRERAVYEHLRELGATQILGFNAPQLLRAEDHRCATVCAGFRRSLFESVAGFSGRGLGGVGS